MDVDAHIHLAAERMRDLHSLCLTSRGMYAIASRVLYRDITLNSRFAAVRLSETLRIKRPRLADLVRSLAVGFVFDARDDDFEERERTLRPHFIEEVMASTAAVHAMRASPRHRMPCRVPAVLTLLLPHLETLTILPPDSRFTNENMTLNYAYYLRIMADSLAEAGTTLPARTLQLQPGASWLCPWGFPHRERDRVPLRLIMEAVGIPGISTLEIQRDEGPYHVPHPAWTRGATRLSDSFLDGTTVRRIMRQANQDPQAEKYIKIGIRDLRLLESSMSSFDLRALLRLLPNLQSFAFSRPRKNELDSLVQYFDGDDDSERDGVSAGADDMDAAFARYPHIAAGLPLSVENLHIDLRIGSKELARLRGSLKQPLFRDPSPEELAQLDWQDDRGVHRFTDTEIHIDAPGGQPGDPDAAAASEPEPPKAWPSRGPLASRRRMLNGLSTLHGVKRLTVRLELLHEAGTELRHTPIEALLPPTVEELRVIEPIAAVYVKLLSLDSAVFNEAGWSPLPRTYVGHGDDEEDNNQPPPPPPLESDTAVHACLPSYPTVRHARPLGPTELVLAHALEKHERYDEHDLTSTDIFAHDGPADGENADWALAAVDLSEKDLPLAPPLEGYLPDLHACLSRLLLLLLPAAAPQSRLRRVVLVLTQEQHVESFTLSAHPYVLRPEVLAMVEDLRLRFAERGAVFEAVPFSEIERRGPGAPW